MFGFTSGVGSWVIDRRSSFNSSPLVSGGCEVEMEDGCGELYGAYMLVSVGS